MPQDLILVSAYVVTVGYVWHSALQGALAATVLALLFAARSRASATHS